MHASLMNSTENASFQTQPLVSVVTPTYNQAAFLRDTIESVLSQDYPAIEFQIIDDGSTDNTPDILKEYDGRALIERHENRGQTPTINKGWERANGEILTWLNSDDTFLPGAVTAAVDYLQKHPEVGIVFGDTLFTNPDGSPIERSADRSGFDFYNWFIRQCEKRDRRPWRARSIVLLLHGLGFLVARRRESRDHLRSRIMVDLSAAC